MAYVLLDELNSARDDWTIKVRICRMWESLNLKNNDELISLDMIFIDEKENMIHATIRKNQVSKYRYLLNEGGMFDIKNFKVIRSTGQYQPLLNDYKIVFHLITSVKRIEEGITKIVRYGFQFVTPELIDSRINDNRVLSDIIGCLSAVGNIEVVGMSRKKRDIEIVTDFSMTAKITLWGKIAETFDFNFYEKKDGPFILIATSTTVKKFQGEVGFSSTSGTKIYVNLEMPYVKSLIERFSTVATNIQILESRSSNKIPFEEQMFLNRMTIKQLLQTEWDGNMKEHNITVRAKITDVDNFFGWCYVSCNICSKKVVAANNLYICHTCNKECKFPLVRYKIHLKVNDDTAASTFVLFNMEAEKLLDTSAFKLLNRQSPNSIDVPVQIRNLSGKYFIFKLKLNNYNLKEGLENYCISKIFAPDERLELEYKSQMPSKVIKGAQKFEKKQIASDTPSEKENDIEVISPQWLEDSEKESPRSNNVKRRKKGKTIMDEEGTNDDENITRKRKLIYSD